MPYDETLTERVRTVIGARSGVTERSMFGSRAFFIGGNIAVAASTEGLLVRLAPDDAERAFAEPHVSPFGRPGRPMRGWVKVEPHAVVDDDDLASWVDAGADHAASLPEKG